MIISQLKCKCFPYIISVSNSSGGILDMEHIDIKFIAKKSGCSIATVSRVINRSKPVSEELQKRVIDTIRKYNYNPSIYAQNLAGKKSKITWFLS